MDRAKDVERMLEQLQTLQEQSLLTPLTTVITALFAVLAVFINNAFVSRNLTRQLRAQTQENNKKLLSEAKIATLREKRVKLESLFLHLQQYLDEIEQCFQISRRAEPLDESEAKELSLLVKGLKEKYERSSKHLSMAQVLASAYSDVITNEFDLIRSEGEPVKNLFELLTLFELTKEKNCTSDQELLHYQRRIENMHLLQGYKIADKSEENIKTTIADIEKLLIEEIRSLVKQEHQV